MKGGDLTIHAALGAEGDGIDSNGYIALEGGTIRIDGITAPDSAMDSEDGIYYTAGTVILDGKTQSYAPGSVFRETGGMSGPGGMGNMGGMGTRPGMPGGQDFDLQKFKDAVAALPDTAGYEDVLALLGGASMPGQGPGGDWTDPMDRFPRNERKNTPLKGGWAQGFIGFDRFFSRYTARKNGHRRQPAAIFCVCLTEKSLVQNCHRHLPRDGAGADPARQKSGES